MNQLFSDGTLSSGEGNSLIAKLQAAIDQLDRYNEHPARNQLEAFVNELNAMITSDRLEPEIGESLIDLIEDVLAEL